jgi:hypothetical protein
MAADSTAQTTSRTLPVGDFVFLVLQPGIVDPGRSWHFSFELFGVYFPTISTPFILSCCLLVATTLSPSEPESGIEGVITSVLYTAD